jgi:hypothetical protein
MKNIFKKIILSLTLLILCPVSGTALALNFSDISPDNNYDLPIHFLRSVGIVVGFPEDNTYRPNEYLTKATAAKVVLGAYETDVDHLLPVPALDPSTIFKDMSPLAPYAKYLVKADELGIFHPDADGYWKPNDPITRAEFMRLLLTTSNLDLSTMDDQQMFADVPQNAWFSKYMNMAGKYGLIIPDKDNNLYPSELVRRGEAAEIGYILFLGMKSNNTDLIISQMQANFDKAFYYLDKGNLLAAKRRISFSVGLGQLIYNLHPTDPLVLANAKLAKAGNYAINFVISNRIRGNETDANAWLQAAKNKAIDALSYDNSISGRINVIRTYFPN